MWSSGTSCWRGQIPMSLINFANNLEDLAEEIGKWRGMAEGIEQPVYMDSLITRAFDIAEEKFNMAASLGADDFDFAHMYEYGTRGIGEQTEGASLDPMSQSARLWKSFLVGGGGRKMITFEYRPAVQPNPPKTRENTGIESSKFDPSKLAINKGKEYVWYQKAQTVEENKSVFVKVKDANLLFVPLQEGPQNTTNTDRERGYTFRKAVITRPGEWLHGAGKFTLFFADWWSDQGAVEMESEMLNEFNIDVKEWQSKNPTIKSALKPATSVNIVGVANTARGKTRKQWEITARNKQGKVKVL